MGYGGINMPDEYYMKHAEHKITPFWTGCKFMELPKKKKKKKKKVASVKK
jgi:hypothetical protein